MMIVEKSVCTGCSACSLVCPKGCVSMVMDNDGFLYPKVDETKCINCSICIQRCPVIMKRSIHNSPIAYAVYNKNDSIRMDSSSGGVFTLLAEQILQKGGVVFGAAFDSDFNVIHIGVKDVDELNRLRGSKYVQSNIGDSYKKVEEHLKENKLVYFSGTPCQVTGLLSFLNRDYENLITQDIICHGVPSPMVWRKYLDYQSEKFASLPINVSFRKKKSGTSRYSISIEFENGTRYESLPENDLMMITFLQNQCLRNSCYNCQFKSRNRTSDLTLADYWGIQNVHPEMDDKKGTSLVFLNSEKGRKIFDDINESVICAETDIDIAITYNSSAVKSAIKPQTRDVFMDRIINSNDFEKTVNEICKDSFLQKMKKNVRKLASIKSIFNK